MLITINENITSGPPLLEPCPAVFKTSCGRKFKFGMRPDVAKF